MHWFGNKNVVLEEDLIENLSSNSESGMEVADQDFDDKPKEESKMTINIKQEDKG